MKITLERLREIITEEVIKEAVEPEDAQRTIVALLQGTPANVTGDIMGAVYDEMYDAGVSEPQPEAEEEKIPTEYQPGGAFGDRPEITLGPVNEIVQEEYYLYKIEQHINAELLTEVRGMRIEDAEEIMAKLDADPSDPTVSREDAWDAKMTVREYEQGGYTDPEELRQQALSKTREVITNPMRRTTAQIKQLEDMWRQYKGDLRGAIETIQADNNEEQTIVDALASFYNYLTSTGNIQQHDVS